MPTKRLISSILNLLCAFGAFFYFKHQTYYARQTRNQNEPTPIVNNKHAQRHTLITVCLYGLVLVRIEK